MAATDQNYRNQKTLDIIFAVSCVLMLLSIVWMFWQDYSREFKRVQREFRDVDEALTERSMLDRLPDPSRVREASDAVVKARSKLNEIKVANEKEFRQLYADKAKQEAA